MKAGVLQAASNFTSSPIEPSLRSALAEAGIAQELRFHQYAQMNEYLLGGNPASPGTVGTLVLLRVEDWLRDELKATTPGTAGDPARPQIRRLLRGRLDEFLGQLEPLCRRGRQVWFMACPSSGWISERHKLGALCQTYTNLLVARIHALPHVTILRWPAALFAMEINDRTADRLGQVPYTQTAFDQLGRSVSVQMGRTLEASSMDIPPLPSVGPPVELAAYLAGLHVRVQISPATRDDRNSMDHLLRDAAGFSLTGENRDLQDADLDGLLDSRECLLVRVADRLADYGPSGLVAFRQAEGGLVIDAMTLSCTVLGKQVEYALVSALAQIARARRASKLLFGYRASGRNQPMLAFLESVADRESATRYVLPLDVASERIAAAAVSFETWAVDGTLH